MYWCVADPQCIYAVLWADECRGAGSWSVAARYNRRLKCGEPTRRRRRRPTQDENRIVARTSWGSLFTLYACDPSLTLTQFCELLETVYDKKLLTHSLTHCANHFLHHYKATYSLICAVVLLGNYSPTCVGTVLCCRACETITKHLHDR